MYKKRERMIDQIRKYAELLHWPNITADEKDDQLFEERQEKFFNYCVENDLRPTIECFLATAGITRKEYKAWQDGTIRVSERRRQAIKKLDSILLGLLTEWSLNGNVNPPASIFNLKNNYDYEDKTEHVIKPAVPLIEQPKSNEEIEAIMASDAGEIPAEEKKKAIEVHYYEANAKKDH